jgi:DNA-binding transcriptional ArsR family regulator
LGRQESAKDISWDVGFETPAGVTRGGGGNHDQVAFSPLQRTAETKTVYAPLNKGPAFQLGRAAAGEDESRRAGLCHTLLNLPGIKQQDGDGVEKVDVPKTRRDLADYLGLTIETVSQTLTKLKQDGLIALAAATRIEIRDRGQLEELTADEIKTNV